MAKNTRNRKRRRNSNLIKKTRWAGYAAAGAATAMVGQEAAQAGIIHVDPVDVVIGSPIPASGSVTSFVDFDLNGDGQNDVRFKQENLNSLGQANAFFDVLSNTIASFGENLIAGKWPYGRYPYNMAPGALLSANSPSYINSSFPGFIQQYGWMASGAPGTGTYASEFQQAGPGYVGLHFESASGTHYAWIRVEMTGDTYNGITVTDWAYNDTDGASILVGQIPEPGSLGLLALGGAGLLAWRRKRAQMVAEAKA
jgi:hypothetical protein